jgi:hypothetical protein
MGKFKGKRSSFNFQLNLQRLVLEGAQQRGRCCGGQQTEYCSMPTPMLHGYWTRQPPSSLSSRLVLHCIPPAGGRCFTPCTPSAMLICPTGGRHANLLRSVHRRSCHSVTLRGFSRVSVIQAKSTLFLQRRSEVITDKFSPI